MVGMSKLDLKDRRRQRRRNHVAKDLKTDKYRQKIIPSKRQKETQISDDEETDY